MPVSAPAVDSSAALSSSLRRYAEVRARSLALAAPLSAEDQCVQSMPDASPTKWHLAHTTWFFEAMVLVPHARDYRPFDARFFYLFNSYYEALGPRHPRAMRGLLTRPSVDEVLAYRAHVDAAMLGFMRGCGEDRQAAVLPLITLGLHHEQQHQELLLTDVLHALSCNPMLPAYQSSDVPLLRLATSPASASWLPHAERIVEIGHGDDSFAFDNETPRHRRLLPAFEIADRLVTCGEYAQFIADGGYRRPELWLSDGWAAVQGQGWQSPIYWFPAADARVQAHQLAKSGTADWYVFGLNGLQPLDPSAAVTQLSFFEASAYAEWSGARLPTEFEWEAAFDTPGMRQMDGTAWQWTRSAYDPYPGFRPLAGMAGEYNGKFMVGQLILRGSSLATPPGHARRSYRNFFPPAARWQFSGIRLARDL
ncbi:sulfatase maturase [Rhodoferax koreense]|uniref:Sulfatase maturase n=1 Tax=Rhodoferax koreensis TaxID=1842727 RepID=A0A1P8JVW1_9BURK|nr:sulfatase maturase [Rhodoferax koreense]